MNPPGLSSKPISPLELYSLPNLAKHVVMKRSPLSFQASVLDFLLDSVLDEQKEKDSVEIPVSD